MSEPLFDKRFLGFGLGFPWTVAFFFAAAALLMRRTEPETMGVLFSGNHVLTSLNYPAFILIGAVLIGVIGSVLGALGSARLKQRWLRKPFMGLMVGVSLFLCGVGAALLVGQSGSSTAEGSHPDSMVLALGGGAALALGVIVVFVYQPAPLWNARDEKALGLALAGMVDEPRISYWVHTRASSYTFLTMLALLPGGLLSVLSGWVALVWVVLLALVALSLFARVTLDAGGPAAPATPRLRVLIAGVLPVLRVPLADVTGADAEAARVWENGGPGLRRRRIGPARKPVLQYLGGHGSAVRIQTARRELLLGTSNHINAPELAKYLVRRGSGH